MYLEAKKKKVKKAVLNLLGYLLSCFHQLNWCFFQPFPPFMAFDILYACLADTLTIQPKATQLAFRKDMTPVFSFLIFSWHTR